jgi:competence protein ComGC
MLVVITVIVVLLALLAPALDRAIYQAELAVCGANQRSIASGAMTYAMASNRSYPYRAGVKEGTVWAPTTIYNGNPGWNAFVNGLATQVDMTVYDDRPILRTFLSLNGHLNDPLTGTIDFEAADDDANVDAVPSLWFGFKHPNQRGMHRLGDRWTYVPPGAGAGWNFDVLVCDTVIMNGTTNVQSSHPDDEGKMLNRARVNHDNGTPGFKYVKSYWWSNNGTGRGLVDINFALQDGSVERYNKVGMLDSDMARVPYFNYGVGWWSTLPPQK